MVQVILLLKPSSVLMTQTCIHYFVHLNVFILCGDLRAEGTQYVSQTLTKIRFKWLFEALSELAQNIVYNGFGPLQRGTCHQSFK